VSTHSISLYTLKNTLLLPTVHLVRPDKHNQVTDKDIAEIVKNELFNPSTPRNNICVRQWKHIKNVFSSIIGVIHRLYSTTVGKIFDDEFEDYDMTESDCEQEDQPSDVHMLLQDIQIEFSNIQETMKHLKFQNINDLNVIAEISYELDEGDSLLEEFKKKYREMDNFKDVIELVNNHETNFKEIRAEFNRLVLKHHASCHTLINNYYKDKKLKETPSSDESVVLYDWHAQIYTTCVKVYQDATVNSIKVLIKETPTQTQGVTLSRPSLKKNQPLKNSQLKVESIDLQALIETPSGSKGIESLQNIQRLIGIKNGGNNCYAIASIQSLFTIPDILKRIDEPVVYPSFRERMVKSNGQKESKEEYQHALQDYTQLCSHLDKIKQSLQSLKNVYFTPTSTPLKVHKELIKLKNMIFELKVHPSFLLNEVSAQQDAADFCSVILQTLNYVSEVKNTIIAFNENKQEYKSTEVSTQQIFQLSIKKNSKKRTFQRLIKENIVERVNDTTNSWKYDNSLSFSKYKRTTRLSEKEPPEFISFHIKRYGFDKKTKKPTKIGENFAINSEPMDLALLFSSSMKKPAFYQVVSTVNHLGKTSIHGGHYTSYVKRGNDWYECNDSGISLIDSQKVLEGQAYLVMMQRVDPETIEDDLTE